MKKLTYSRHEVVDRGSGVGGLLAGVQSLHVDRSTLQVDYQRTLYTVLLWHLIS